MKVVTILGTRPEIIRLCLIISKLDCICDHILVHTGQNYDHNLNDVFMSELKVRKPDYCLGAKGTFGEQIALILSKMEDILIKENPDRFLVLGDTNSSMAAVISKRLGIPVYHMEAGNRCYDDRVPEEVNRRIIDHSSDVLLPYTDRSRQNLIREGIAGKRILVTGNPIFEVLEHFSCEISNSKILLSLKIAEKKYILVTMHRAENVDIKVRFESFILAFRQLYNIYRLPIIVSTHPRTRCKIENFKIDVGDSDIRFLPPFGFFDFVKLEKNAFVVLSDSGTVQEECAIFNVPNVTIRDVTERPETLEAGSNMLSGASSDSILQCVKTVLAQNQTWNPPDGYLKNNVSDTVIKILLGYLHNA